MGLEKGGKLFSPALACGFESRRVLCQFVEHNQHLTTAKHTLEVRPAWSRMRGHLLLDLTVEFLAADLASGFIGAGSRIAYLRVGSLMRYREAFALAVKPLPEGDDDDRR
jgi:hypothetical protein